MKHITTLLLTLSVSITAWAQQKFPYDSINHQVVYSQSFKLSPKVKQADAYAAALGWFGDPLKFTRKNADPPIDAEKARSNQRKIEAESQFANPRPLQMQDPAGGKVQGMGIIRYFGTGNSIKLLYLKYDINIKIDATKATISVSNIHYFHYSIPSYKQAPLYNFSGGKPCEEVGTLENLIGCENFHEEFKGLAAYCYKEINGQITDFQNLLKQKKYIYDAKATSTPVKAAAKTSAKKK